jgi:hypothetical protein
LVEPLQGTTRATGLLVGVRTLPVLQVESGLGKQVKWVLGLGLFLRDEVNIVIIFLYLFLRLLLRLRGGGSSGLGLFLLLGRRYIL